VELKEHGGKRDRLMLDDADLAEFLKQEIGAGDEHRGFHRPSHR